MATLYILDQKDQLLATLSPETGLVSALYREEVNRLPDRPFSFTLDAASEVAAHVVEENQVVFQDKEEELRLFVIKELDEENGVDGASVTATCQPAFMELAEHIVVERRFVDQTAKRALDAALQGTRWIGTVEVELGESTTNFYYISSVDAIWKILNTWGGEFKDTVIFDGNKIVKREIRILARRGVDNGKRFEIGHNVEEVKRTVISYPITALYGRGASLPTEDEDGNETGGYSRYIDFAGIEWKESKGDPTDKPKGQRWVGDTRALQKYGREHGGKLLHREAVWQNGDIEDPAELLKATWERLQEASKPEINYQLSVQLLETIAGYGHEKVQLGDTARVVDRNFSRPIEAQTRVISLEYDLLDVEGTAQVEMGQFLSVHDPFDQVDKIVAELADKRRHWDTGSEPISPSRYPDIVPTVPIVEANGLFSAVQVSWDYDYLATYVAGYEVYASEVKDFVPSPETLVWRGIGNSFSYFGEVNKQYYFRVRAFNYHARYSPFSEEVTGTTRRIISEDILFGEAVAAQLRELSKSAAIIAENALNGEMLAENEITAKHLAANSITVGTTAIQNGAIANAHLGEAIIKEAQIDKGAIKTAHIGSLKVDRSWIAESTITHAQIASVDASKITTGALDASKIRVRAMSGRRAVQIDADGLKSFDSAGRHRILIGVQSFGGAGADPAVVRFFDESRRNMGYVGANRNEHMVLYSAGFLHVEAEKNAEWRAQQHRFPTRGVGANMTRNFVTFDSVNNTGGTAREPRIHTQISKTGYLGTNGAQWWRIYCHHGHFVQTHNLSSRKYKEGIEKVDVADIQKVFDRITLKKFRYKINDNLSETDVNLGVIAEESPNEILSATKDSVVLGKYISIVAGALKFQQKRIDHLEALLQRG
ncbi:phage tail spike protein [Shouchella lonarensis]|uniref:Phage minor structural protein, N-terminal region n=1 Tax=Shouchella lonarensis TaxID=1464122 RepID=A0A1G6HPS0_9BACI|nr:phage tail spike protein [Shouchella lonarensis]SDB96232.1 phage minor structural protein, N-terminal region [Shouchella lonarensis]